MKCVIYLLFLRFVSGVKFLQRDIRVGEGMVFNDGVVPSSRNKFNESQKIKPGAKTNKKMCEKLLCIQKEQASDFEQ